MKQGRTVLVCAAIAAGFPPPPASAQDASAPEEIEITVGADGTSVVREVRSAQLVAGESSLRVFDVSPQLLPETVALRALSNPELVELKQQTAWFEVLDMTRVLERLSGRPTTLVRYQESGIEKLEGRLLFPPVAPGPNGEVTLPLFLEHSDGHIRMLSGGELELDSLPPGDWNRFRLDWRIACRRSDRYRLELVYVTRGLQWRVDHLLRVATDQATADVTSVATLDNATGVAWRGARLALAEPDELLPWSRRADPAERQSARFHPVADGATLDARATTQFTLAQARDVKVRVVPTFLVDLENPGARLPVVRRFDVVDGAARGLARALPAGTARVVLVDAKNRPFVAATRPFAATRAGDVLSFHADALPGVVASCDRGPVSGRLHGTHVALRIWNERDEKLEVEAVCPLDVADVVEESGFPADRTTQGVVRFLVPVLPHSSALLEFNLGRP